MKILHVVPSMLRDGGGPSESVPMTAMAQKRAGLDVAIAYYDAGELSDAAKKAGQLGVRLVSFRGRVSLLNPAAFSLDFMRRFERVAREYDVIHTHVQWMFPIWWAAHVARKLGKKLVMMPRGCFAAARLRESAWKKKLVGWLDRRAARNADAIWATSQSEAVEIKAYVPGAHVEVFPIGLDVGRYSVSKQNGKTLLYLSRISPIKGLDLLAEAWGKLGGRSWSSELELESGGGDFSWSQRVGVSEKGWKLVVAGPDDRGYTDEIKKVFAAKCSSGSYEFRGPVYGEEKFNLLSQADAFVLPTRNENWGIAVAEAMASCLPVICTKGAPWQCLETAHAGWWTDVSVEGLETALKSLCSMSAAERLKMGANARRWVEENLDWTVIGRNMSESYGRSLPILMTATVDTRGMAGADFTSEEREGMYLDAIRFYLNTVPDYGRKRLVFVENSGWDLGRMEEKLGESLRGRVEFLSLDPSGFNIARGKGYNEFLLVSQAVRRSESIRKAGAFLKVTGRYPIYNIKRFLREAERAIYGRDCGFYGDIKDHGLYDFLHLPITGHIGSSILFASTVRSWIDGIEPRIERLDDAGGYWSEHLIYDYLMECRRSGRPVSCRFSRELRCGGLKGSKGTGIAFSKRNDSLKETINRHVGNLVRITMPWFWF